MSIDQESEAVIAVHGLDQAEGPPTKAQACQFSEKNIAINTIISLIFWYFRYYYIFSSINLRNVNKSCRVLSTLPFSLLKKRSENHNCIAGASPAPETILLWTQHAVSLHNASHLLAHPGGDEPQKVRGDCDRPVN